MFDTNSIGKSFPAFTIEVERAKLHEFALAIGETDPIYHARQEAQEEGYEDVQMLPTMPTQFEFWGNPGWMERLREIGLNTTRLLHVEQEFAYLGEVRPGDVQDTRIPAQDRKSTRLNSSHQIISYPVFCLQKTPQFLYSLYTDSH